MSKRRYIMGVDPAAANGDVSALTVLRQDANGTIWIVDEASSLDDGFYDKMNEWMVRTGELPIDIRAALVDESPALGDGKPE